MFDPFIGLFHLCTVVRLRHFKLDKFSLYSVDINQNFVVLEHLTIINKIYRLLPASNCSAHHSVLNHLIYSMINAQKTAARESVPFTSLWHGMHGVSTCTTLEREPQLELDKSVWSAYKCFLQLRELWDFHESAYMHSLHTCHKF